MTPTMKFEPDHLPIGGHKSETGTATFIAAGLTHSIARCTEHDARLMHLLLVETHNAAIKAGQRALSQLVVGTVEPYRAG